MIAKASARYIRISPRKVRQVVDLIRGKNANEAFALLSNLNKGATVYVDELLQSAVSNAKRKMPDVLPQDLRITKFTVDGGPTMVRYRAASMGRATMIRKRTSHLIVELDVKEKKKAQKSEATKTTKASRRKR